MTTYVYFERLAFLMARDHSVTVNDRAPSLYTPGERLEAARQERARLAEYRQALGVLTLESVNA